MKASVKALKSKYALFIISIIAIIAAQVGIQYWFDQESTLSLILSGLAIVIIILEFVYIFLPSLKRLSSINRKLIRLRKNLEYRERQYRELVEGATDIIYELNSKGEFTFVNELMLSMSGYTLEEVTGKPYLELIHPDDQAYAMRFYRDQLKSGKEVSYFEFRMFGKHGQTYWIGQNVRFFYEGAWVSKVRVVARDITEGRQAQLALQKLKEEAEQTTLAKSQFLSMMSHEIRTPMNAIIGLTNLLLDSKLTDEQRSNVELLKFSGDNLLTIINDILDFSKIEAQKIVLEKIDFDMRDLVSRMLQIHKPKAIEKGILLTHEIDGQFPGYIKGDPVRIIQIITNLVTNAIKFTDRGRVMLTIHVNSVNADIVNFDLIVSDTGIGIAADKLVTIFESFSQAEEATTRKYGGTGLGLAITKKLVELMGGTITVSSVKSPGSTGGSEFRVSLVMPIGAEPVKEANDDIETLPIRQDAHILLAEDSALNQLVAISFLSKWNIKVSTAVNGAEALALMSEPVPDNTFDLILMDLQMPEMSGYEVTEKIRAMPGPYYKNIPIIALTASAMSEVKDKVLAAGMNDFLSKPFQPLELKQILAKYIPAEVSSGHENYQSDTYPGTDANKPHDKSLDERLLKSALDDLHELNAALKKALFENKIDQFLETLHKSRNTIVLVGERFGNKNLQEAATVLVEAFKTSLPQATSHSILTRFIQALADATEAVRNKAG